jgi:hypothetical protein
MDWKNTWSFTPIWCMIIQWLSILIWMDDLFDLILDPLFIILAGSPQCDWNLKIFPLRLTLCLCNTIIMVDLPWCNPPHQTGVQGGFLIVGSKAIDFDQYIETIMCGGNFTLKHGWGGSNLLMVVTMEHTPYKVSLAITTATLNRIDHLRWIGAITTPHGWWAY